MKTATENQIIINDFSTEDYNVYVDYSEDGEKTWKQVDIHIGIVQEWADFENVLHPVKDCPGPDGEHVQEIGDIDFIGYLEREFSEEDAASLIKFCQMFHPEISK